MSEFHLYIGNKCFSSWSLRPWIALRRCGIPFKETLIRLRTPETAANLAKVSPTGLVPVLLHGKTVIWETLAILEYLADSPDRQLAGRPPGAVAALRGDGDAWRASNSAMAG
jgi:glutathione S-transferase